jgi:transcriptional regulator with XRE-family HTH domain
MRDAKGDMSFVGQQPRLSLVASFSARLRQWREAAHVPLKRMAADLGVSVSVVSAWEQGECFPTATHLERLSIYTGVPLCQFFYPGPGICPNSHLTLLSLTRGLPCAAALDDACGAVRRSTDRNSS